jgi:pimeloyl-ACP methyl ester carboxylesterase
MNQRFRMSRSSFHHPSSAAHFVLLHGAWHGGWCWRQVAAILAARGHVVSRPTQTGLGERRHLLSQHVDFDTFVSDIHNHLLFEDIHSAVVVGHSFGASVAAAVADRDRSRISRLVFLDGFLPESGRSLMEQRSPAVARERSLAE